MFLDVYNYHSSIENTYRQTNSKTLGKYMKTARHVDKKSEFGQEKVLREIFCLRSPLFMTIAKKISGIIRRNI